MSSETASPPPMSAASRGPRRSSTSCSPRTTARPVDLAEFDRVIGAAVADRVAHQVDAGIDLVSDGEMSKIGYATYIRHRLSGFEVGDVPRATPADLDAYPRFRDRLAQPGGSARVPAPDLPRPDHLRAPRAAGARPRRA